MAASTDLTTLSKVKDYLGITDTASDTLIGNLIDAVSEAIEQYCHREFAEQLRTEIHDGCDNATVVLSVRPISSVTSLHSDNTRTFAADTLIDPARYTTYPEEGLLTLDGGLFMSGIRNIQIIYTAGFATIPPAIEQAANILVAHFFNRGRQGGDGVESESLGSYTVSYDTGDWPYQARGLLAEYREVVM